MSQLKKKKCFNKKRIQYVDLCIPLQVQEFNIGELIADNYASFKKNFENDIPLKKKKTLIIIGTIIFINKLVYPNQSIQLGEDKTKNNF